MNQGKASGGVAAKRNSSLPERQSHSAHPGGRAEGTRNVTRIDDKLMLFWLCEWQFDLLFRGSDAYKIGKLFCGSAALMCGIALCCKYLCCDCALEVRDVLILGRVQFSRLCRFDVRNGSAFPSLRLPRFWRRRRREALPRLTLTASHQLNRGIASWRHSREKQAIATGKAKPSRTSKRRSRETRKVNV